MVYADSLAASTKSVCYLLLQGSADTGTLKMDSELWCILLTVIDCILCGTKLDTTTRRITLQHPNLLLYAMNVCYAMAVACEEFANIVPGINVCDALCFYLIDATSGHASLFKPYPNWIPHIPPWIFSASVRVLRPFCLTNASVQSIYT